MENYVIKDLKWDTEYFLVNSGRIDIFATLEDKQIDEINKKIKAYDYLTIINHENDNKNNEIISKLNGAVLRDINVQLVKKCEKLIFNNDNVLVENNLKTDEQMLKIAEKAFRYSRFYNDSKLDLSKSKKVYYNWLKNAFEKQEKHICSYREKNKTLGFLLFSFENDKKEAIIELIAVDDEYSGKGVGKKLMEAFESYSYKNGAEILKVGTQLNNITAQNFYISCKYKIASYNTIYHLWKEKWNEEMSNSVYS
ncbi:MAG: GNAT family N-acetyltransferase [Clostridia bacterium]|nr:GNAT family N-acetyltransferase [Clostridia bacterium]MDD4375345.1 GNAT family N-acetyltransferase [Clostridia bacterium]